MTSLDWVIELAQQELRRSSSPLVDNQCMEPSIREQAEARVRLMETGPNPVQWEIMGLDWVPPGGWRASAIRWTMRDIRHERRAARWAAFWTRIKGSSADAR